METYKIRIAAIKKDGNMPLRPRDIKLAARQYLAGLDINILEGPAASAEHRLVAQYDEVVKSVDQYDSQTFKLSWAMLRNLYKQDPHNITLQCLLLVNHTAFREPSPRSCDFLQKNGPAQVQYGLNVLPYILDGLRSLDRPKDVIEATTENFSAHLSLNEKDIARLKEKFRLSGMPKEHIPGEVEKFTKLCQSRKILVPSPA